MTTINDPKQLAGLEQASYVMKSLVSNDSEEQITRTLGGDKQLFEMWKSFLKHNQWMTESKHGWSVTEKGAMWTMRVKTR
jgi:hypothetical protein